MPKIYIAIDGDNVGQQLELYMFTNNLEQLRAFSLAFKRQMEWLEERLLTDFHANIVFSGGDNLLAVATFEDAFSIDIHLLKNLAKQFQEVGNTLSIGIGKSPRQAFLALNFAKVSGKNSIKFYSEISDV